MDHGLLKQGRVSERKPTKVNRFFTSGNQPQGLGAAALIATGNVSEPENHPGIAACGWSRLIGERVILHVLCETTRSSQERMTQFAFQTRLFGGGEAT